MHTFRCKKCGSANVKKNGLTAAGRQKYHCKDCSIYTTTDDIEQLDNTLRQWCANLVRKTLSFSKALELHKTRIRMMIEHCNARRSVGSSMT